MGTLGASPRGSPMYQRKKTRFMKQICRFDPLSDIEPVVPDLAVDIAEVMATNTVVSTGDSSPYTKETDVHEVGHYLRDKIDTMVAVARVSRSLSEQAAASADNKN